MSKSNVSFFRNGLSLPRILLVLGISFFGIKSLIIYQKEGAIIGFGHMNFDLMCLILLTTIEIILGLKTYFITRKLIQVVGSVVGVAFVIFSVQSERRFNQIVHSKAIFVARTPPGDRAVFLEFKENNKLVIREYSGPLSEKVFIGRYISNGLQISIIKSNYKGYLKLAEKGTIVNDTLFWNNGSKMTIINTNSVK
jgi:hypothetical protein